MNIFLNLDTSDTLIEYIYGDNTNIINTDDAPFYLMENGHTNYKHLMNRDGLDAITNNTRNRSVANIEEQSKQYALLTPNKLGAVYNDYDDKLTNTQDLPLNFISTEGVIYDTIRLHFIQGFSFNDFFSGVSLNVWVKDKTGQRINLLDVIYKVQDNYAIMNPNPFLYGGRQYATYVEYKVPSLKYLIDSYINEYVTGGDDDILSYKISNGNGFYKNTLIEISSGRYGEITKLDNQLYTKKIASEETSISSKDDFSDIGVFIGESSDGDFLEFYGTYNSQIFGDYMTRLNNSGLGQHIAIHKLTITEQIPNTTGQYILVGKYNPLTNFPDLSDNVYLSNFQDGNYWVATQTGFSTELNLSVNKGDFLVYNPALPSTIKIEVVNGYDMEEYADVAQFIRTSEQEFIQDNDFGDENTFRPVLKFGGSALSYKVDYTLQILNTNTSSVIEKFGSYVSFQPEKYGKTLLKLNTRDNISTFDVYNKKVIKNIENVVPTTQSLITNTSLYNKNITSFKQVNNVYASSKEVSIDVDGNIVPKVNPDAITNVKGQGTATIYISPFDTFVQFGLYEESGKTIKSIDLNKIGEIYLNFTNKNGEVIKISSTKNANVDESKGQILFRVKPELYNQIINSGNDVFFITSKVGDNSPETVFYTGKYKQYSEISDDETQLLIEQQRQTINDLNDSIEELEKQLIEAQTTSTTTTPINARVEREGSTADDKSINQQSSKIKKSTFNIFGPTSISPTSI